MHRLARNFETTRRVDTPRRSNAGITTDEERAISRGGKCQSRADLDQPDAARDARSLAQNVGKKESVRVFTPIGQLVGASMLDDALRQKFANSQRSQGLNGFCVADNQAIRVIARMGFRV